MDKNKLHDNFKELLDLFILMTSSKRTKKLAEYLESLKEEIADDYRASDDPEDNTPGMQVTVACNELFYQFETQTGDNSYTGACYGLPFWSVIYLYRDSDTKELADLAIDDLHVQVIENASHLS